MMRSPITLGAPPFLPGIVFQRLGLMKQGGFGDFVQTNQYGQAEEASARTWARSRPATAPNRPARI